MKLPQNIVVNYRTETSWGDTYHTAEALIWDKDGHPINGVGTPIWGLSLCGHIYNSGSGPRLIGWDRAVVDQAGRLDETRLRGALFALSRVNRALEKAEAEIGHDNPWRNGLLLMAFADALKAKHIVIGSGTASNYRDMQWQTYGIKPGTAVVMGMIDHAIGGEVAA